MSALGEQELKGLGMAEMVMLEKGDTKSSRSFRGIIKSMAHQVTSQDRECSGHQHISGPPVLVPVWPRTVSIYIPFKMPHFKLNLLYQRQNRASCNNVQTCLGHNQWLPLQWYVGGSCAWELADVVQLERIGRVS
jgi:hypothetical protein